MFVKFLYRIEFNVESFMHIYDFDFTSKPLLIATNTQLSEHLIYKIEVIIDSLSEELNHTIIDSPAYRFNRAPTESVIRLNAEFISFLKLNLNFQAYNSQIRTVLFNRIGKDMNQLINIKANLVVKKSDIRLDTSVLKNAFIIELIRKLLISNNIQEFKISSDDIVIAIGTKPYAVNFKLTKTKNFKSSASNQVLLRIVPQYNDKKEIPMKFASKDYIIDLEHLILRGNNIIELYYSALKLHKKNLYSDFIKLANEDKIKLILFDKNEVIHEFAPII
ncbi:MAG: hypothetical protein Q9M91_02055 [Candidatus Dojkabacteria bacterium]|nr:hypothetical protein [Candidatus Dojkabacteria bacterium]MDQ7020607.1 hypothetical protein [Candidatus Dojkabacteria bacterium]